MFHVIRPLESGDEPVIADWIAGSDPWRTLGYVPAEWPRILAAIARDEAREAEVITVDGRPVGLAVVGRRVLLGDYLELFAIAPASRGRGLGRALLSHVEARVLSRTRNFYLCVSDFNREARAFYAAAGYEEVGRLDDLIVSGRAEILMRKTRGPARPAAQG